ncbi:MAG TPA: sigma-70 family RNA polymerase sigma factor [Actinomycetota bacterium]
MTSEHLSAAIDAARAGAEWAWTVIYDELAPSVLGYLRARGAAEPEDLTGEVFLQAVRDLHRFEGSGGDLRAWMFTIAHHRFLDERRRAKRRPVEPAPDEVLTEKLPSVDTESEAMDRVAQDEVTAIIDRLAPAQRDVLLLRIVAGLTIEEIAAAVGKRPGAVKALQHRGIAALRRELTKGGVSL